MNVRVENLEKAVASLEAAVTKLERAAVEKPAKNSTVKKSK